MSKRRIAIVLHGPPATGKSTLLKQLATRLGDASSSLSLDTGWASGEIRRNGGPDRYADLRQAVKPALLIEIGCGEPMDLSFPGATRAANEWIEIAQECGRDIFAFLLRVDWKDAVQRIEERWAVHPSKLFWVWQQLGVHALYAHKHPMVTFAPDCGLHEHPIDTTTLSAAQAADEVRRIVGL